MENLGCWRSDALLDQGIYGKMQHPRYLRLLWEIAGATFLTNNLAVYVLFAVAIPLLCFRALLEEREITERLGDKNIGYMRRVPRFLPPRAIVGRRVKHT